jgi:anti-sigma regulatory factor (Ser/Thr protein kinase)
MVTRSITVNASIDQLPSVNEFLAEAIRPEFDALGPKIEVAVEELLVNVCSYAYGGEGGEVEVVCRRVNFDGKPFIIIAIRDWGQPFDPFRQSPEPDTGSPIPDRPVGGLGVHLVKKLASHYCYEYSGQANISELLFERPNVG